VAAIGAALYVRVIWQQPGLQWNPAHTDTRLASAADPTSVGWWQNGVKMCKMYALWAASGLPLRGYCCPVASASWSSFRGLYARAALVRASARYLCTDPADMLFMQAGVRPVTAGAFAAGV